MSYCTFYYKGFYGCNPSRFHFYPRWPPLAPVDVDFARAQLLRGMLSPLFLWTDHPPSLPRGLATALRQLLRHAAATTFTTDTTAAAAAAAASAGTSAAAAAATTGTSAAAISSAGATTTTSAGDVMSGNGEAAREMALEIGREIARGRLRPGGLVLEGGNASRVRAGLARRLQQLLGPALVKARIEPRCFTRGRWRGLAQYAMEAEGLPERGAAAGSVLRGAKTAPRGGIAASNGEGTVEVAAGSAAKQSKAAGSAPKQSEARLLSLSAELLPRVVTWLRTCLAARERVRQLEQGSPRLNGEVATRDGSTFWSWA